MPEMRLENFAYKVFPLELLTRLSLFVERGKVKVIFRTDNFTERLDMLVTGEKRSWGKDEFTDFIQLVIVPISDPAVIHYTLN